MNAMISTAAHGQHRNRRARADSCRHAQLVGCRNRSSERHRDELSQARRVAQRRVAEKESQTGLQNVRAKDTASVCGLTLQRLG
jgi:hypothetical protein